MMENQSRWEKPLISVLACVYNNEDTLRRCLDSIVMQTFSYWECILCNDGSTDGSQKIISEYVTKDSRFRAINNPVNMGLTHSLNLCIAEARASVFARQDADDWSEKKRFEIQYEFLKQHPEYSIIGTCAYNVNDQGKKKEIRYIEKPKAIDLVNKKCLYNHGTWMMKREDIAAVGNYTDRKEVIRSQDYDMSLKLYASGRKIYNIQNPLYYTFRGEAAIRRMRNWKRVKGLMWIRWNGFRANHFPLWTYIYVVKPFIAMLIPYKVKSIQFNKSKTT